MRKIIKRFFLVSLLLALSFGAVFGSCGEIPTEITDFTTERRIPDYYFENDYLDNRVKVINEAIEDSSESCEAFFG